MSEKNEDIELPEGYILVESMSGDVVLAPDGMQMTVEQALAIAAGQEIVMVPDDPVAGPAAAAPPVQWMDSDTSDLRQALDRRSLNREALMEWLRGALVDQIDYGRIHFVKRANCEVMKKGKVCENPNHYSKPTLWKAGAEKITGMLGLRPHWPDMVDEFKSLKGGAKMVVLRCQLLDPSGNVQGEGLGARTLDQDGGDVNKALKMCKKSSLVDAALSAGGLSEVFTQDMGGVGSGSDPDEEPDVLNDDGQRFLKDLVIRLFCADLEAAGPADGEGMSPAEEHAETILQSLACRRFRLDDGNWRAIPAYRLQDAIRSLEEKKADQDLVLGEEDARDEPV